MTVGDELAWALNDASTPSAQGRTERKPSPWGRYQVLQRSEITERASPPPPVDIRAPVLLNAQLEPLWQDLILRQPGTVQGPLGMPRANNEMPIDRKQTHVR